VRSLINLLRNNHLVYSTFRRLRNRYQIWKYSSRNVHPTFYISPKCKISRDLIAHEYGFIGDGCRIGPKVELGKYVMFGPHVAIVGADHCIDKPGTPMIFSGRPELFPTVIEDDVWVGYGTTIMAGVRIGRGSIIAAGAVVTKDIPPYQIYGGIPARKIGERFQQEVDKLMHDGMLNEAPIERSFCQYR
jgi:acetyltransferase-like isoleucine patch superfamily enzyme